MTWQLNNSNNRKVNIWVEFQIGDVYLLIDKENIEGYKTGMNNQGGEPHVVRC